jgi:thioredoxin reductase (NADPH)
MQDRVLNDPKIEVIWDTVLEEIYGELEPHKKVTGVRLANMSTSAVTNLELDGVFVAIGHKPNSDLFKGVLNMDEVGYLITDGKSSATNVPGVFAAGDVADSVYRQAVTAAGTGCMAAIDAERYLSSLVPHSLPH